MKIQTNLHEYLLYKNIAGEKHGNGDTYYQENIAPAFLRTNTHELLIIDANEKAGSKDG